MKRLLLVDQFGHWGGGQVVLRDVATAAVGAGIETHLAAPAGPVTETLEEAGVIVHDLRLPTLRSHHKGLRDMARFGVAAPFIAARLDSVSREVRPDLIHVNGGRLLPQSALGPRCRPLAYHAHSAYDDTGSRWLARCSLRLVRRPLAIAPSPFMRLWTIRRLGLAPDQVALVWNWVDDRLFDCDLPAGTPTSPARVVVLGRVTPLKGQLSALRAFLGLPAALRTHARLEIIGPVDHQAGGADYARLLAAEAVGHSDISCQFEHVGTLAALQGAFACIVPSRIEETFGLVAAEAMAAGVPVIASDIGALPEVVGDAGVRVPPGDVAELSSALSSLLSDDIRRCALAEAGRARARQLFNRERQVAAVLEALDHHARQGQ